jgi:signal transduction histidine kinase
MTGEFALDWAIMAVSLFNTILLLWLGLTVLLNAERKNWGTWLIGGGLLLGAAFFVSHSAILGHGLHDTGRGMDFWWRVGWMPVVALPFAWYVVMLWYAGFWEKGEPYLRRRHCSWFLFVVLLVAGLIGLLALGNPLPSYGQVAQLNLSAAPAIGGIPVLVLAYPLYTLLCISLSLDALGRPGPSTRVMGNLARRRAHPWLVAASLVLLLVSMLVAWVMLWIVVSARQRTAVDRYLALAVTVGWFDLAIATLIGAATVLLGQAVVSYEVFTGKALPQRGLVRQWRSAILLAAGYGALVGWSLVYQLRSIYSLLLTAMLMVVFYALSSWRSFAERRQAMERLRPFVTTQRLYESLVPYTGTSQPDVDVTIPLRALCDDVLGARVVHLVALGPLAPLFGPPLTYPTDMAPHPALHQSLAEIAGQLASPLAMCLAVDPARYGGAAWAVPLWSERGLTGVLLLGDKRDGGLYSQEEIEIARASGERLIDMRATAKTAQRLMALLRQRLAEVKVIGEQGRRVLHDQVLPQLHLALLYLSGLSEMSATPQAGDDPCAAAVAQAMDALTAAHRQISDLMRDAAAAPHHLAQHGLVAALQSWVEADCHFEEVAWEVGTEVAQTLERLPPFVSEVIWFAAQELVRNAARHGRGGNSQRPLRLRIAVHAEDGLRLAVVDDGVGFGSREESAPQAAAGSGSGLQFHSTMLAAVGASLEVVALPGNGTRATIQLPSDAATQFEQA